MTLKKENETKKERYSLEKNAILDKLRDSGFRVTRQREKILDVILDGNCTSIKEVYAVVKKDDPTVGFATVYRMINLLEEIGVISRKNLYRIPEKPLPPGNSDRFFCTLTLSDHSTIELTSREWSRVVTAGLRHIGMLKDQMITGISISSTVIDNHEKTFP